MNIVIAVDSLKGSLSSLEAGRAVSRGIRKVYPDAEICVRPLADGGEGTVEALTVGLNGTLEKLTVTGPLGDPVQASYGILDPTPGSPCKTAVIEMASAAGLTLVPEEKRNPYYTTTYGVGELIRDALQKGCRHFIIGIGGSATNDGGIGMLQALGYGLLDKNHHPVPFGAIGLKALKQITETSVMPELKDCSFRIACDVTNPLCGEQGCSAVFAPQKGASPSEIIQMDQWLKDYASLCRKKYSHADMLAAGTGAAGGLGFAFLTFTNAVLESGIKIILEETHLEEHIKNADFVITGEGRLDSQTVMGKAPIGVAAIAKKHSKKVIAFSGCAAEDAGICNSNGIDAYFPILQEAVTLSAAMEPERAARNMTDTAEQVFRLIRTCRSSDS